jgi:hypothetical protein
MLTDASQFLRTCRGVTPGQVPLALEISPKQGKKVARFHPVGVWNATT